MNQTPSASLPQAAAPAADNAQAYRELVALFQEILARSMRDRYTGNVSLTVCLKAGTITHSYEDHHKSRRFGRHTPET
jgi:hypothetical protein